MGRYVDLLKAYYSAKVPVDEEILPSVFDGAADVCETVGRDIRTRDALSAVLLDCVGAEFPSASVVILLVDEGRCAGDVESFLRSIHDPKFVQLRNSGYKDGTHYSHVGRYEIASGGDRDGYIEAFQQGACVCFICNTANSIDGRILPFVDKIYDIRGPLGKSVYDVISIVCGVPVSAIIHAKVLEALTWQLLYACVRPNSSLTQVMDRVLKFAFPDDGNKDDGKKGDADTDAVVDLLADLAPDEPEKPRLRDLDGYGAAKDWGMQLAQDFLLYRDGLLDWDDMDRGILLSGPPGCGKTYFARALAEECGVPLVFCSYADIEANTGSGNLTNKAIKKIWDDARKKAPCIVFMDELDSVGVRGERGHNNGWWTSIVNGLLAELDGANPRTGVVAIGATNFPDQIDPALRRPGRLDRHVKIPRPSIADLPGVIRHHMPADADFSALQRAAVACRGRSPAEIAQACRDARRVARRNGRTVTCMDVVGVIESSRPNIAAKDTYRVSVHEAGHAVIALAVGHTVDYIDVDAGQTKTSAGSVYPTEEDLTAIVIVNLSGRAAEEVLIGSPCAGATADLEAATETVRKMLSQFGFGGRLAHVPDDTYRVRRDIVEAVEQRVDELYQRTLDLVRRHVTGIQRVAKRVSHDRYLDGDQIRSAMAWTPLLDRQVAEEAYEAPCDDERGNPRNRSKIRLAA